jgi:hypothetical protein
MWRAARGLVVLLVLAPHLTYGGDDAIGNLRSRLKYRGYDQQVIAGPMAASWQGDAPDPPSMGIPPAAPGAYLVLTDAGAWWVWSNGLDSGPIPAEEVEKWRES